MERDNYQIDGFYVPRERGETAKAFKAKIDYLLLLERRSLTALHELYVERSRNGVGVPSRHKSTLAEWSGKNRWVSLAEQFDQERTGRLVDEAIEKKKQQYIEQLEEFATFHKACGRKSFRITATAVKQLMEFVESLEEQGKDLKTLDDCLKLAAIVQKIFPLIQWWSQALAVDALLNGKQFPWEE
jgi:hypothetical protein